MEKMETATGRDRKWKFSSNYRSDSTEAGNSHLRGFRQSFPTVPPRPPPPPAHHHCVAADDETVCNITPTNEWRRDSKQQRPKTLCNCVLGRMTFRSKNSGDRGTTLTFSANGRGSLFCLSLAFSFLASSPVRGRHSDEEENLSFRPVES